MGGNKRKEWKNGIFVPFFLCLYLVLSSLLAEIDVKVVQMSIGFELWFVVGCFIADEYFFVGECFLREIRKGGGVDLDDWVRNRFGLAVLAEYVLTRARMRALVLWVLFFAVTSVTADGVENTSSSQKQRVVLLKTSYRFAENNVSFYWKQRVVLLKTTCCFGLKVEK